jgi:hypothetical protein
LTSLNRPDVQATNGVLGKGHRSANFFLTVLALGGWLASNAAIMAPAITDDDIAIGRSTVRPRYPSRMTPASVGWKPQAS